MPILTRFFRNVYKNIYQTAIKHKQGVGWILALIVILVSIISYECSFADRLELITLDYRFHLRPLVVRSQDVVFIDMAEDSINVIGRWPWPRKWHAAIVSILTPYHPKAIAFDVVFSEPQDDTDDGALEEAVRASDVVYMPSIYDIDGAQRSGFYKGQGVLAKHGPIPRLASVIKGSGHINAVSDSDGILRRVPPVIRIKDAVTYQLGIKMGLDILGVKESDIVFYPRFHEITAKLPGGKVLKIPLDKNNQLIVNWIGKWGREFKHYSYIDVIKSYAAIKAGEKPFIDLNVFKDKICIIGLTAAGLIDIKPIPIESAYPAVGTNAMVVSSVLSADFIREVPDWVNILLLITISVAATLVLCYLRLLSGILFAVASILLYAIISILLFVFGNLVIVTFYPILAIAFAYLLTAAYTQILQSIERANLFKQATRDGLTQLYNIRHFNLLFEAEFRNVAAFKFRSLSVIMCDLDNFKHANDTYGHPAGDVILKEVAAIIQSKCRQLDVVGRYGGEEFIVMLSGSKAKDAADVGEKIRSAVEAKKFKFGNATYSTTLSLGVAEYGNEKTKNKLVEKADKALYYSKKAGKNKVTIYTDKMRQGSI